MLRFFNLVSQGSAVNKTCIPVFLAMSMFNAANALSVTLTGEAEFGYNLVGDSISEYWDYSLPHVVVSGEQSDLYYSFEITDGAYQGHFSPPTVTIGLRDIVQFRYAEECEEVLDLDIFINNCTSISFFDVSGWEVQLLSASVSQLSDIIPGLFVAGEGAIGGVAIRAAVHVGSHDYWLQSDAQFGSIGIETEMHGNLSGPIEPNRVEMYTTFLGPRLYVEYDGGGLGEYGAKLGAFQFAGTLSDGDAFNDLEVEWSTDLAEGLALESQMRLGGTFQASLMTHLSF